MKKIVFALALMMIFTSIIPSISYGDKEYNEKLEEAILKAKELFDITDGYDEFSSNINSYDGNTIFYLNWRDTKEKLNNINITIDIYGNIISFDSYSSNYKEPGNKLPKYSKEQAEDLAINFIKRVSPDIKSIKISNDNNSDNLNNEFYNFQYTRYINEIEYRENNINISINKYTGEISNYYVNWDRNTEFPSKDKIIELEKAKEMFKEKIGLKPVYKSNRYYRPMNIEENENEHYLAYTVLDMNKGIDAFTGEKININYYRFYSNEMTSDEGLRGGITPKEQESIDELKDILNEKQSQEKARQILGIEDDYKLQNQNLYKDYKNPKDYTWNMYFVKEYKEDFNSDISIGIDAKTGELLSFYKSVNYSEKDKNTVNKEEALKLAKDYLNKQNPEKRDKVELIEEIDNYIIPNMESKSYRFRFIRKEDDIYVENDNINIEVDAVNGEIISYSIDWYKGEFPSNKNMISIEKAYDILWKEIGLDLMYVKISDDKPAPKIQYDRDMIVKLAYSLNTDKPAIIDGITGEVLDYSGKPYKEREVISYDDIENSYAKDKIRTLAGYGIGFNEGKFLPEEEIKQSDYIYLLWKSMYQYRTDKPNKEDMYNDFIRLGYIEEIEKDPDSIVTKAEGVKYVIRMMNLREVAEIKGIYKDVFLDERNIKEESKGYINLAYGLKIIKGNGTGNINPNHNLKRQDAASIIYNYLFR